METKLNSIDATHLQDLTNREQLDDWLARMNLRAVGADEYWSYVAGFTVSAALQAINLRPNRNLTGPNDRLALLVSALSSFDKLEELAAGIDSTCSPEHARGKTHVQEIIGYWQEGSPEHFAGQYQHLMHLTAQKILALVATSPEPIG
ncbi:hypothetical protein [Pseudomonas mosselii]|uniref:hypothetical protein n=1 Tax=Pseudomonas mosselii TaxID=78327 RepID=UPI0021D91BC7|nr:hypothetical protein [Pseudomonas mosselii]MCU9527597.1 hypothetical protein [Pseudomonas mosselii]MCU9534910.1 hypothetical protein [Pseudomonas mosselii]MCU9542413.1 hypothetical protein [Pseudomonas mosselii]MCU9546750.1 hypothetical protein [Pseudomonas mosselii]